MPLDLSARVRRPELMDDSALDPELHHHALRALERCNRISLVRRLVWPPIAALARRRQDRPLTVLDVACGAGDLAIGLVRRSRASGLALDVHGCDISPTAVDHARRRAQQLGADVHFVRHDVHDGSLPGAYDIVTCSLFLHHLEPDEAIRLLAAMAVAARSLVVVTDLDRSLVGWATAWLGTRLLTRSPVVHVDGPRSVRAAWSIPETRALAADAGLSGAVVTRHWPSRWRAVWSAR